MCWNNILNIFRVLNDYIWKAHKKDFVYKCIFRHIVEVITTFIPYQKKVLLFT